MRSQSLSCLLKKTVERVTLTPKPLRVDACDQVAKENGEEADEGLNSYADLAGGAGGRRNSEMPYDKHVVAAAEGNTVADEYVDEI